MDASVAAGSENVGKYTSYAGFARRYCRLFDEYAAKGGTLDLGVHSLNLTQMPPHAPWPQEKRWFDSVYSELSLFITALQEKSPVKEKKVFELVGFFSKNLRRGVIRVPTCEKDVQDVIETLFIGRGDQKGRDYDRETGRVKFSGKEFVPDFVIPSELIAIEVKFVGELGRAKAVIDEMNADVIAFLTKYQRVLFVVYDLGFVRDVNEFGAGLEATAGVSVCVIKQ
ncbi:MAG TPA: hypothetical protein VJ476_09985 [Rhizomicrobium sp.]|nr:hypothetical protein [Rhizomicrobium sp.]